MTHAATDTRLAELAATARGEATEASRAALYAQGQALLLRYIWNDIDGDDFLDALVDFMNAVELLPDDERSD